MRLSESVHSGISRLFFRMSIICTPIARPAYSLPGRSPTPAELTFESFALERSLNKLERH